MKKMYILILVVFFCSCGLRSTCPTPVLRGKEIRRFAAGVADSSAKYTLIGLPDHSIAEKRMISIAEKHKLSDLKPEKLRGWAPNFNLKVRRLKNWAEKLSPCELLDCMLSSKFYLYDQRVVFAAIMERKTNAKSSRASSSMFYSTEIFRQDLKKWCMELGCDCALYQFEEGCHQCQLAVSSELLASQKLEGYTAEEFYSLHNADSTLKHSSIVFPVNLAQKGEYLLSQTTPISIFNTFSIQLRSKKGKLIASNEKVTSIYLKFKIFKRHLYYLTFTFNGPPVSCSGAVLSLKRKT